MGTVEPTSMHSAQAPRKPLVLVVDDDQVHHKLFHLIADRLDISAHLVSSCAEAIKALGEHSIDLILMDCRMPEVDGYTCTVRIRQLDDARKDIPIIAVTACVLPGDREKCLESGMNDFLGKPFTLDQLNQKIHDWLPQIVEESV